MVTKPTDPAERICENCIHYMPSGYEDGDIPGRAEATDGNCYANPPVPDVTWFLSLALRASGSVRGELPKGDAGEMKPDTPAEAMERLEYKAADQSAGWMLPVVDFNKPACRHFEHVKGLESYSVRKISDADHESRERAMFDSSEEDNDNPDGE